MTDSYDVVVVGAGLGGVSAAAFLARAGKRVLVVEQLEGPGGYAHAFRRGDYIFDPAIRTIGQGVAEPTLDTMLAALGVRDRCELLPIDHFYGAVLSDASFVVPAGRQAFVDFHCELFPREADGFRRFMDVCEQVTRESLEFMPVGLSLAELDAAAIRYPTLFRYLKATLGDVLEEFVQDERLRALCAAGWPYLGLPPSKLSFFTWTAMIMSLLEPGPFYSRGSFQRIVDAFVAAVATAGGDLELGRRVTSIELDGDGRVKGVALDDGRTIVAPVVVSNADAGQTLERLVGADSLPEPLVRQLRRMTPSSSAFVVYAATTLDLGALGAAHETFVYRSWDHDESWNAVLAGRPDALSISVPTVVDPSLAPAGQHLVTAMMFAPRELGIPWTDAKERYEKLLVGELERIFPGFTEQIEFLESATPLAFERFSLDQHAAIYGWENNPRQAGIRRLSHVMPVQGLFLSGHWTQPGTGSLAVIYSGLQTAQMILGSPEPSAFLRGLGYSAA